MIGVIVKGIGGFYYVLAEDQIYECKARGIFRKNHETPMVGDRVEINVSLDEQNTVDAILPRTNVFERPPVANVETMVLVVAAKDPEPNMFLVDRFTVAARAADADVILCVNKMDLASDAVLREFSEIYASVYPLFFVSGKTGTGLSQLKNALQGCQAAFAGPSGVGKSTLLNILLGAERNITGTLSEKTSRGKHTTRHTELFAGEGLKIFDTPGFTSFELTHVQEPELQYFFPEMAPLLGQCRFDDCIHLFEPGCAVIDAVAHGQIHKSRYQSYVDMLNVIKAKKKY
ncbi:MAG: ribosome small subunit-dependent GTPase A [Clostridia bacterium]|nr:ribosome small subunit-dependent GTPase A [Clostridia bacterium]